MSDKHPIGSKVTFKPGPKSTGEVTATVTGIDHPFLVTKDAVGKERRIRAGAARPA